METRTGGALQKEQWLNGLPAVGIEDTVHDMEDQPPEIIPPAPGSALVECEEDLIGQQASIVYHRCLQQLVEYLLMPVRTCTYKDPFTRVDCNAPQPFDVKIHARGTSAVIEWDLYCVNSIKEFWNEEGSSHNLVEVKGQCSDAHMDSPGFSAQYCMYTTMDNDTKEIILVVNIDKRVTQKNSVIMEKEAYV
ncbi:uncharacterized protein LOC125294097 [Xyrichtys novacula]|uniref:Uncharacterized protein LOC125294097 n=1 Tax=Xyrichtys novacula TaxID=13765 RepID=A0AAV1HMD6_XYRNO|nr:uncharacterized protein LOC125294097 [Xyrichtys novacula]